MKWVIKLPKAAVFRRHPVHLRCDEAVTHIHALVDQQLSDGELEARIQMHLSDCPPCATEADTLRALKAAIIRVSTHQDSDLAFRLRQMANELCVDGSSPFEWRSNPLGGPSWPSGPGAQSPPR